MNKVLVTVSVPLVEKEFDVYIPINKKIGYIKVLLERALPELSEGNFKSVISTIYDASTGLEYDDDAFVKESSIRNGTKLILM